MEDNGQRTNQDSIYRARLLAQHKLVLSLLLLPVVSLAGAFVGRPLAAGTTGFPLLFFPAGLVTSGLGIGAGLLLLALLQGAWSIARGFWNLEWAMEELPGEQRLIWYTALTGLFFLGFFFGCGIAYLIF